MFSFCVTGSPPHDQQPARSGSAHRDFQEEWSTGHGGISFTNQTHYIIKPFPLIIRLPSYIYLHIYLIFIILIPYLFEFPEISCDIKHNYFACVQINHFVALIYANPFGKLRSVKHIFN